MALNPRMLTTVGRLQQELRTSFPADSVPASQVNTVTLNSFQPQPYSYGLTINGVFFSSGTFGGFEPQDVILAALAASITTWNMTLGNIPFVTPVVTGTGSSAVLTLTATGIFPVTYTLAGANLTVYQTRAPFSDELTALILEASEYLSGRCNRAFFYARNFTESLAAYASTNLQVKRHTPIDITQPISIVFDAAPFDPDVYSVSNANLGYIYNKTGWYWTAPLLPNVQQDPFPGYENNLYVVTYSGGWVTPQQAADNPTDPILSNRTLPYDIERACLMVCVWLYRIRGQNPLLESEHLMSYSYTYRKDMLIPFVESVIARYRRTGVSL